jgi:hypothetical protein
MRLKAQGHHVYGVLMPLQDVVLTATCPAGAGLDLSLGSGQQAVFKSLLWLFLWTFDLNSSLLGSSRCGTLCPSPLSPLPASLTRLSPA